MASRSRRRGGLGRRIGGAIAAILLLVAAGGLTGIPVIREIASFLFTPPQEFLSSLGRIGRLSSENARLRRAATELALENFALRESAYENERLRRLLEFSAASGFAMQPVAVVARDASPFGRSLKVDKGSAAGIRVNMPVVTYTGLVGKVIEARGDAAFVQSLQDPDFRVSALVQRSRTAGIMAWDPSGSARLVDVPHHADVQDGDLVVTSGLGDLFPKGILIGRVSGVSDEEGLLFQSIEVEPFVDFSRLEEVFVITGTMARVPLGPAGGAR